MEWTVNMKHEMADNMCACH